MHVERKCRTDDECLSKSHTKYEKSDEVVILTGKCDNSVERLYVRTET